MKYLILCLFLTGCLFNDSNLDKLTITSCVIGYMTAKLEESKPVSKEIAYSMCEEAMK